MKYTLVILFMSILAMPVFATPTANASITPKYVDTNVVNQSFVYSIIVTNETDKLNITIPTGFTNQAVKNVYIKFGTTAVNTSCGSAGVSCDISGSNVVIRSDNSIPQNGTMNVTFTLNTNSSGEFNSSFSSNIYGGGDQAPATDTGWNVTTKKLINVVNVVPIKSTALSNGTDYWEFNFTLNITANVSGLMQFKMSNWNSSAGQINLTNQTQLENATFYATLRESSANYLNITNDYTDKGVSFSYQSLVNVILKMIIPSNTPIASDWWASYSMLFRTT